MQKNIYTYLLAAACLFATTDMWAQRHYLQLVKEIDSAAANVQNQQTDFIDVGGETYFLDTKTYDFGAIAQAIYKTDGTANGTIARVQISIPPANAANKIQGLVSVNNQILYLRNNGLAGFNPQNNSMVNITTTLNIICSVVYDGYFYFVSSIPNSTEFGLYRTDGNVANIAPLAVLAGTNASIKAQIAVVNQQIALSYTDTTSVHFGILPQGSATFQHLQQHNMAVNTDFAAAAIVYNNTIYWTYSDVIFKSDGTPQGSVVTTLPSVKTVRAWTSFGNRILVVTKDTCTSSGGFPESSTCMLYLVSTDGNILIQRHWFGSDDITHYTHNTVARNIKYRFFENNQKLYVHSIYNTYNSMVENDFSNEISEFNAIDSLPNTIYTANRLGRFDKDIVIKDDIFYYNAPSFNSGGQPIYTGLYGFHLDTHALNTIDVRQCQPLTLVNGIIYTSTLHTNGAQQPFKIDICSVIAPPITNIQYDTTGTDIKLRWTAPLNSGLITNFSISTDSLTFGSSGMIEVQHLIQTMPYNVGQSDYFYAFAKPNTAGVTPFAYNLKINTTAGTCGDTLRKTSLNFCNALQPNINLTATHNIANAKSYLTWNLASNENLVDTVKLYKNNTLLRTFTGFVTRDFLDTAALTNDIYRIKMQSNNGCTGTWEKTVTPTIIDCNALQPVANLVSSDTIYDAVNQQYSVRLVWSVQGASSPLDSFKLYKNGQYLTDISSNTGINGVYTQDIRLGNAENECVFTIKIRMSHLPCIYTRDLVSDTLRTICPLQVRIVNFTADTIAGTSGVKLKWKAYNIRNINHFEIRDSSGLRLANIAPSTSNQGNFEYVVNPVTPVTNQYYTLLAVSKNACQNPELVSNNISTSCHNSEKIAINTPIQHRKEALFTVDFELEKTGFGGQASIIENGEASQLMPILKNNKLNYQYEYTCDDLLLHHLEFAYSEPNQNICHNNSRYFTINCDVSNRETAILLPNPASDRFTIALANKSLAATIRIFNNNGQLLHTLTQQYNTMSVDCSNFTNGIYIIEVNDGSTISTLKLVKI